MSDSILCLVARCRACGKVGAGEVIWDRHWQLPSRSDIADFFAKAHYGYSVAVERGSCTVGGCSCTEEQRETAGKLVKSVAKHPELLGELAQRLEEPIVDARDETKAAESETTTPKRETQGAAKERLVKYWLERTALARLSLELMAADAIFFLGQSVRESEEEKLSAFFRDECQQEGEEGDRKRWTPAQCAIETIRDLKHQLFAARREKRIALEERPQWREGQPTSPGLWIVDCNGDLETWRVERDRDESDLFGIGPEYLRFDDADTSEPIKGYPWPPTRSYGPCPMPDGSTDIRSATVAIYEDGLA